MNHRCDQRIDAILTSAGIESLVYFWWGDEDEDLSKGKVLLALHNQSYDTAVQLLTRANKGFVFRSEKSNDLWHPYDFIVFYIEFGTNGEWHLK